MASYRKRDNGLWQYRIIYRDANGNRCEKSKSGFKTKTLAKKEAERIERQLAEGLDTNIKFKDYIDEWYSTFKEPNLSTVTNQRNHTLIKHSKNLFRNKKLAKITRMDYQRAMNKHAEGRAKSTVKKLHDLLKACFRHAEYEGLIDKTPAYNIQLNGSDSKSKELKYLDKAEAHKLRKALLSGFKPSYTARAMCLFAMDTGARLGEVMALCEEDVDFENESVSINKSYEYKFAMDFIPTKTDGSTREIAVGKETIKLLKAMIQYNKQRYIKLGIRPKHKFVFAGPELKPITPRAVLNCLTKFCKKADIKEITFHGLRHTHASILIYEGIPLEYVSQRLGHSSTTITADVYTHVIAEMKDKGDEQVRNLLNGGQMVVNPK